MKTSLNTCALLALCAGGLTLGSFGCASSSTANSSDSTIRASTGEYTDDAVITTNVSNQLVDDLGIQKEKVKVETREGVVTLTGAVENDQLRTRAARIALGSRGVREVKNEIVLMSTVPSTPPHE